MITVAQVRPLACAALAAFALVGPPSRGQDAEPRSRTSGRAAEAARSDVIDDGGMFSTEAIRKAKETLARVDRTFHTAVTVETVESLRGQEMEETAIRRAEQLDHKGIFILIARQDRKAAALASPKALRDELTQAKLHAIRDAFTAEFRKGDTDAGLLKGVQAAYNALAAVRPDAAREGAVVDGGSSGGSSALVLRGQVRLTMLGARRAIAGAEAKALELKLRSNITVVDEAGLLLAFERMDGARPASIATSQTKAVSAATFRAATGPMGGADPYLNLQMQAAAGDSGGKITALLGGLPIVVDGQVVGAIGVAGGTGEQDVEVAKAGVAAFVAGLSEPTDEAKPKAGEPARDETKKATEGSDLVPR